MKVVIAGGGVAAIEAMIALRSLAEERVDIHLVSPTPQFAYRPLAVAEPFGLGRAHSYDLVGIARDHGAALHLAGLQEVDPAVGCIVTWDGRRLDYDLLLVAVGARSVPALPGSITVAGPGYTSRFRTLLRELDEHRVHDVAFAVPSASSWPLPLYELTLMTAAHVAERGLRKVALTLVTPEARPLEMFGADASGAVGELLESRGVTVLTGHSSVEFHDGRLELLGGESLRAERVVSQPRLEGPRLRGLPHDNRGFIPVDRHGRVEGHDDVYAAGDATNSALKQGGVAAQQADSAAEAMAARAGADITPTPFRPVLRGMLLTGESPRYIRAEVTGGRGEESEISEHALWWPPAKIAGRHIAPYLALRGDDLRSGLDGMPVEVAVEPVANA